VALRAAISINFGDAGKEFAGLHSEALEHAIRPLASIQRPSITTAPTAPESCPDDQLQEKISVSHTHIKLSKQTTALLRGGSCTAFGAKKRKETIPYSSAFEAKSNTFEGYQGSTIQTRAGHRRAEKKTIGSLVESCRPLSFLVLLLRTGT
jgi:hypothetical protein